MIELPSVLFTFFPHWFVSSSSHSHVSLFLPSYESREHIQNYIFLYLFIVFWGVFVEFSEGLLWVQYDTYVIDNSCWYQHSITVRDVWEARLHFGSFSFLPFKYHYSEYQVVCVFCFNHQI